MAKTKAFSRPTAAPAKLTSARCIGDLVMPFGKHKGELIVDLDRGYLQWLYENVDLRGDLKDAVESLLEEDAGWERWGSGYKRR